MIGDMDTTALGKNLAPASIRPTLGNYPELGKAAAAAIPHARLVEFPDLGHAPQIEAPDVFHKALFDGLRALAASPIRPVPPRARGREQSRRRQPLVGIAARRNPAADGEYP